MDPNPGRKQKQAGPPCTLLPTDSCFGDTVEADTQKNRDKKAKLVSLQHLSPTLPLSDVPEHWDVSSSVLDYLSFLPEDLRNGFYEFHRFKTQYFSILCPCNSPRFFLVPEATEGDLLPPLRKLLTCCGALSPPCFPLPDCHLLKSLGEGQPGPQCLSE